MKKTKFLVQQFYQSADEQDRKAEIQSILNRYLTARLTQGMALVRVGTEGADRRALREV